MIPGLDGRSSPSFECPDASLTQSRCVTIDQPKKKKIMHGTTTDHLTRAIATTAAKTVIGIKVVLITATRFTLEFSRSPPVNAKSKDDATGCPSEPACSRENNADI